MLRIYAKNLVKIAAAVYRPCAAWVTKWWNKYRTDFFFRSQVDVIMLQVLFTLAVFVVFILILRLVEQNITEAIGAHIAQIFTSDQPITNFTLEEALQETREGTLMRVMAIVLGITGLFGYIITRVTLSPARQALEAQKRFISNIAHELRTPLSVLRTNTDVALLDDHIPTDTKKTLESNREELERISEIINNLLSLSSAIQPERIRFQTVDLGLVTKEAIDKLSPLAKEKHIDLAFQQGDRRVVWGNPTGLEQVAMNVIRNAILYTHKEGYVSIIVEPDYHGHITLSVTDTGVGMAQKELFHVFEPFYRTSHARTRQNTGSGLGLTIVSEILKLHKGKMTIHSSPGKGTTVVISIPAHNESVDTKGDAHEKGREEISVDFSRNNFLSQ